MKQYKFALNKLVRDNMPSIIETQGGSMHYSTLYQEEYIKSLNAKLIEEANEIIEANNINEIIEEIADITEVITSLMKLHNISNNDVEKVRLSKRKLKGGFDKKLFGHYILVDHSHPKINNYLNNPIKYKIIS